MELLGVTGLFVRREADGVRTRAFEASLMLKCMSPWRDEA